MDDKARKQVAAAWVHQHAVEAAKKAAEALAAKGAKSASLKDVLTADQAKQMYIIQARKVNNLAQIAPLQDADPARFRMKAKNVQTGTLASIRRILQTKEQVDIYHKTQAEIRILQNKKQKDLAAKKASKEEIETALLAIYAE